VPITNSKSQKGKRQSKHGSLEKFNSTLYGGQSLNSQIAATGTSKQFQIKIQDGQQNLSCNDDFRAHQMQEIGRAHV
jgi:hypothetical protein